MRKYILYLFASLFIFLIACRNEDSIIFEHEMPQFELKDDAILLEMIAPQGTQINDTIYIVGEFNGGEEAIGQIEWQLENSVDNDVKWAIYLNPSMFVDGKNLSDGFYFYSVKNGKERSISNTDFVHKLDVSLGTRTNVTVSRWESYFQSNNDENGGNVPDSYVIYVKDGTGWGDTYLYAWADGNPTIFGNWPGVLPDAQTEINGITYNCYYTGEANKGTTHNFIFNNNKGSQFDVMSLALDKDYYYSITSSGYVEIDPETGNPITQDPEPKYIIYVEDDSRWGDLAIYGYWDGSPVTPVWPGLTMKTTEIIKGVTYKCFFLDESYTDRDMYLIFNDNKNVQQLGDLKIKVNRDFYFRITSTSAQEIDPETGLPIGGSTNEGYKIYIQDNSAWEALAMYGYSVDGDVTPAWPGLTTYENAIINGVEYKCFTFDESYNNKKMKLIFNNNNGSQFDGPEIIIDKDYYYKITNRNFKVVNPEYPETSESYVYVVYVQDETGWDELSLYAYGSSELFGVWPGKRFDGTTKINGVDYKYFDVTDGNSGTYSLIFNNTDITEDGKKQVDGSYNIIINRDYYYKITTDGSSFSCEEITNSNN